MQYKYILLILLVMLSSCSSIDNNTQHHTINIIIDKKQLRYLQSKQSISNFKQLSSDDIKNIYLSINTYIKQKTITKNQILNLLGTPDYVSIEQKTELWFFKNSTCYINIIWHSGEIYKVVTEPQNDNLNKYLSYYCNYSGKEAHKS